MTPRSLEKTFLDNRKRAYQRWRKREFTIACLALVAHWYEKREIQSEKSTKEELKFVFSGLLDIHRNWNAVATDSETTTNEIKPPTESPPVEDVITETVSNEGI